MTEPGTQGAEQAPVTAASGAASGTPIGEIASEIFAVLGTGRQIAPLSGRIGDFGLPDAYRVAAAVRTLRAQRSERPVGRKIGFTNRTIWPEYNVHAPIWGSIYDRTVFELPGAGMMFSLDGLAEPRIEPEIVFGLHAAPEAGMDEADLLGCVEWVAHGFEIVQSIFPGWRFGPADTVAGFGLHGALLIGRRHPVAPHPEAWRRALSSFEIDLFCGGLRADHGQAANVLGGPLSALRHFVGMLASDAAHPPLQPGEIVTTGTLTRAFPVAAGEVWHTVLEGLALEGARVAFGASEGKAE